MDAESEKSAPLAALRLRIMALTGWRRAAVAFIAGGLCALAYAPIFASPILFLTLPVFVWLIDASPNWRRAASAGWLFGFGYFFFNLFWVGEAFLVEAEKFAWLLPFAVTLLPAGLALFWSAAAAVARLFWTEGIARVFVFAVALAMFEWLRGHVLTGFPWNVPGYALTYPLPLMQSAALFGAYGLTAIALFVFPAPLVAIADEGRHPLYRGRSLAPSRLAASSDRDPLCLRSLAAQRAGDIRQRREDADCAAKRAAAREVARRISAQNFRRSRGFVAGGPAGQSGFACRHHAPRLAGSGDAVLSARNAGSARHSRDCHTARHDADYRGFATRPERRRLAPSSRRQLAR